MRIAKNDIPVRINVPGAIARQQMDFGDPTGYGTLTVKVGKDAEIVLFSPQHEHGKVIDHMLCCMAG